MSVSDETMAAWVREQNRGAPAWADLDASARAWWRDRYTIRHAGIKQDRGRSEGEAVAGEVWQETDNVLLLCVEPGVQWRDFRGDNIPWHAPSIARPLRRLLDVAGNLAPEYGAA